MNQDNEPTAFSIAALLPTEMHDALEEWSGVVHGASTDPIASHVTILVFDSTHPAEEVWQAVAKACDRIAPFEVELSQIMQGPYWGKEGLDIVMLTGTPEDEGISTLIDLRDELLNALQPVLSEQPEPPPEGEYRPHLTLTTGLPPHEATRLVHQADGMTARFEIDELALWQQPSHRDNGPWDLVGLVPLQSMD